MDPFSHAALGRTLIALGPQERSSPALCAAGTLGALSPDIDAVFMPFGWDIYLRAHEIGTHTAVGTVAAALLTAAVVRMFARTQAWPVLVATAWAGAASHVLLDLLSSARLRVLWPLDDRQVSIPLVAMADPWLAAMLIGGVCLLLFARRRRRVAAVVIAACAAFLVTKAFVGARAFEAYRAAEGADASATPQIVEARWAALSEWHVFDRAAGHLRFWRSSGASRRAQLILSWPVGAPSPSIAASRSLSAVRNFLRVHDLAFAATVDRPDDRRWILWSDIRYCWDPESARAPRLEPIIGAEGKRLACALWFGGEFDRNGNALHQLVKVGGFTQRRDVHE